MRDRINAIPALLSHTDINGITHPARYPQLSADAQAGRIDPKHAIQAAKKLDKAAPIIKRQTVPAQRTGTMERQILESLRTQGPQATGKLITAWHRSMDEEHRGEPGGEEALGVRAIDLAARAETTKSTLSHIEKGARQVSPSTLRKIAIGLGIPTEVISYPDFQPAMA